MRILALDTATEACSVALLDDAEVRMRYEVLGRGHAERVLPMIDELLAEAGTSLGALDAIAFGRGPGAFTGVRIAVSVAQGLSLGTGLPLVPISDLRALAAAALAATRADHALVCLDARMGEVYWGLGRPDPASGCALVAEGLAPPGNVPDLPPGSRPVAAGHGWTAYPLLEERFGPRLAARWPLLLPDAATIARLAVAEVRAGRTVTAANAEPVYLRNDVATRSSRAPGR